MLSVVGRKSGPLKDIHVLILRICECYLLWQKWGGLGIFAYVTKLNILKWGDYSELSVWTLNAIMYTLIRGRQREVLHILSRRWYKDKEERDLEMGPQAKERWWPPEVGSDKE